MHTITQDVEGLRTSISETQIWLGCLWQAHIIEQFKADCKILFEGPLSDLKDKQWAGFDNQLAW